MNDPRGAANAPVPFGGAIDKAQYLRVFRVLMPRWGRWYSLLAFCILLFVALGTGWTQVLDKPVSALIDVLESVMVLVIGLGVRRWQANRSWRNYARLHGSVKGHVTDAGLQWRTESAVVTLGWGKLLGFRIEDDIALVYYAPRSAFFLPRGFFANEADWTMLREVLAQHLKPL